MWNLGETSPCLQLEAWGLRGRTIRGGHHPLAPRERAVKAKMRESPAPMESGRSDSQEGQLRNHRERQLVSLCQAQLGGPDLGAQRSWDGGAGLCSTGCLGKGSVARG